MTQEIALRFDNVSFDYRGLQVLSGIDLAIAKGEFVAILGANGTGKSTTLRLADGLLKPKQGSGEVLGRDTAKSRTSEIARRVGFLFQNPDRQICQNTTREEVAFGLKTLFPHDAQRVEQRTQEVLELLHLDGDIDPFSLAKGQRQAVALAGLIAVDPDLLLLDEPTTGFDYSECMEMMAHIKRMNEAGTTVIMVCHDMEVVLDFAKRAIVIADGHIVADGPVREIFGRRDVLACASLLPPQICELSQMLEREYPELADIFGVQEMVDAIAALASCSKREVA